MFAKATKVVVPTGTFFLLVAAVILLLLPKEAPPPPNWDIQLQKEEVAVVVLAETVQTSENGVVEIATATLENGNCRTRINVDGINNPFEIIKRECESPEFQNEAFHKAIEHFLKYIDGDGILMKLIEAGLKELLMIP